MTQLSFRKSSSPKCDWPVPSLKYLFATVATSCSFQYLQQLHATTLLTAITDRVWLDEHPAEERIQRWRTTHSGRLEVDVEAVFPQGEVCYLSTHTSLRLSRTRSTLKAVMKRVLSLESTHFFPKRAWSIETSQRESVRALHFEQTKCHQVRPH